MADRTVRVQLLLAAQGYMQGMDQVSKKTQETGTKLEKLNAQRDGLNRLGNAALGFGTAMGVGVGIAVAKFAEFDQQMSAVQAATHETAANMDLLRDAAIEAGARTVYSASEAAAAVEELAKAGVSTADILGGGLDGALDLAAAGAIEVADAAEIAASAMTQFELSGDQVSHVADLLAAGAGKAQGGVQEMSQALNQSGLVAAQMGLTLDDTVGSLTLFASAGLLGSDAGTSFRNMLLRLANPTGESAELMKELGLNFYDAQGNFVGMAGVAEQLKVRLQDLTQEQRNAALAQIFGQDAIRSASILYEGGAKAVEEWTDAVNDAGYAQETAATRLDNLKGDWEGLTGALDSAFITMGEGANGPLRTLVQGLTGMINAFNDLPDEGQQAVLLFTALTGAVGLAVGAVLKAVPAFSELRASFTSLNLSMGRTAIAGAGIGVALGVVAAVVTSLAARQAEAEATARSYAATLEEGTQKVTDATRELVAEDFTKAAGFWEQLSAFGRRGDTVADSVDKLGLSLERVTDAAVGDADALDELNAYFGLVRSSASYAQEEADRLGITTRELYDAVDNTSAGLREHGAVLDNAANKARQAEQATGDATETSRTAAQQYMDEADAVGSLEDELRDLIDTINEANGVNQDAITANIQYEEILDDVDAQLKAIADGEEGYAAGLDAANASGRDNLQLLQEQATRAQDLAEAQYQLDHNTGDYISRLQSSRDTFIENAERLGATKDEAIELADAIFAIPDEKQIEVLAQTEEALEKANSLAAAIRNIPGRRDIVINEVVQQTGARRGEVGAAYDGGSPVDPNAAGNLYVGGKVVEFAAGGFASGIYPYTRGGIHKFAEAFDEAYISMDPKYRSRSLAIHEQVGERLGAYRPAPDYVLAQQSGGSGAGFSGTYSPTIVQRPGVSDRRIAQVAAEELAFKLK